MVGIDLTSASNDNISRSDVQRLISLNQQDAVQINDADKFPKGVMIWTGDHWITSNIVDALTSDPKYTSSFIATWTAFPFTAGSANLGGGFMPCGYWKDPFGIVHLRGVLTYTAGVPANPQAIGSFPAALGPIASEIFVVMGAAATADGESALRLNVGVGGGVSVQSADALAWTGSFLSISGISYTTN